MIRTRLLCAAILVAAPLAAQPRSAPGEAGSAAPAASNPAPGPGSPEHAPAPGTNLERRPFLPLPVPLMHLVFEYADEPVDEKGKVQFPRWDHLPFRDPAAGGRFSPASPLVTSTRLSRRRDLDWLQPGPLQVLGYGLPVAFPRFHGLEPDHLLLSYEDLGSTEDGRWVRRQQNLGAGPALPEERVALRGRVEAIYLEGLTWGLDDKDGWSSQYVEKVPIRLRGLRIEAGAPDLPGCVDGWGAASRCLAPFDAVPNVQGPGKVPGTAFTDGHALRFAARCDGAVTTLCGAPGEAGLADGAGTAARFHSPTYLALVHGPGKFGDGFGPWYDGQCRGANLLVVDRGNRRVRAVKARTREVYTLPGETLVDPRGIALGWSSHPDVPDRHILSIYLADQGRNQILVYSVTEGAWKPIAGAERTPGTADGPGPEARFRDLKGLALVAAPEAVPTLFVLDGHALRSVRYDGGQYRVETVAGCVDKGGFLDVLAGRLAPETPCFRNPTSITANHMYLCVSDTGNHCIRIYDLERGTLQTLAGDPKEGAFRPGLLRDGLDEWPEDERYASLHHPLGMHLAQVEGEDDTNMNLNLAVASGTCVGLAALPAVAESFNIAMAWSEVPKVIAGTPSTLRFVATGEDAPGLSYRTRWWDGDGCEIPELEQAWVEALPDTVIELKDLLFPESLSPGRECRLIITILTHQGVSQEYSFSVAVGVPAPVPSTALPASHPTLPGAPAE